MAIGLFNPCLRSTVYLLLVVYCLLSTVYLLCAFAFCAIPVYIDVAVLSGVRAIKMDRKNDRKNTYLLVAVVSAAVCIGAVITYVFLHVPDDLEPERPYDEDEILADAEKLFKAGATHLAESKELMRDLRKHGDQCRELMYKASYELLGAQALVEKVINYREEHGLKVEGTKAYKLLREIELLLPDPNVTPSMDN